MEQSLHFHFYTNSFLLGKKQGVRGPQRQIGTLRFFNMVHKETLNAYKKFCFVLVSK